jgi:hypothetical protein
LEDTPDANLTLVGRLAACTFRGTLQRITVEAPSAQGVIPLTFDLPAYQTSLQTSALVPVTLPDLGQPVHLIVYRALMLLLPDDA